MQAIRVHNGVWNALSIARRNDSSLNAMQNPEVRAHRIRNIHDGKQTSWYTSSRGASRLQRSEAWPPYTFTSPLVTAEQNKNKAA